MRISIVAILCLALTSSWAQPVVDTTYQVEVTVTACPMMNFFRLPRIPETTSRTSLGAGLSVRGMWHPGRLLSVGLLTGYFVIARDEIAVDRPGTDLYYNALLSAIPVQLALSMQKNNIELGMGIGPYLMMSTIEGGSSAHVHGSRFELGMTYFGSYMFPLSEQFAIGPELRLLSFRYRGIISVMPSFSFRVTALRY